MDNQELRAVSANFSDSDELSDDSMVYMDPNGDFSMVWALNISRDIENRVQSHSNFVPTKSALSSLGNSVYGIQVINASKITDNTGCSEWSYGIFKEGDSLVDVI